MIDPLVLKSFAQKVHEKQAGLGTLALGGGLALGGMGALGLGRNVVRDMNYGRAERLEEKARRMKAVQQAANMPRYNQNINMGGMHG